MQGNIFSVPQDHQLPVNQFPGFCQDFNVLLSNWIFLCF